MCFCWLGKQRWKLFFCIVTAYKLKRIMHGNIVFAGRRLWLLIAENTFGEVFLVNIRYLLVFWKAFLRHRSSMEKQLWNRYQTYRYIVKSSQNDSSVLLSGDNGNGLWGPYKNMTVNNIFVYIRSVPDLSNHRWACVQLNHSEVFAKVKAHLSVCRCKALIFASHSKKKILLPHFLDMSRASDNVLLNVFCKIYATFSFLLKF
jgi:hypothetical protein